MYMYKMETEIRLHLWTGVAYGLKHELTNFQVMKSRITLALLLALPILAQQDYLVPYADGSDGWQDAYNQAKGQSNRITVSPELKVALVAQMTVEEKLNITQQSISDAPVGAVQRLGYPGLVYADGSEGIRGAPFASSTPMALTGKTHVAVQNSYPAVASFDRDLWYKRAKAIGEEARIKGITTQFGPGVNLMRTPQAGRAFECEWLFLPDNLANEQTMGLTHISQDKLQFSMSMDCRIRASWLWSDTTLATMTRRVEPGLAPTWMTGRHKLGGDSKLMNSTAHELYVWPFQDAIHAGCVSVMCSYNGLNGTYSCADPVSMGKWLHEELNFQGWVLSDFGSVYEGTEIGAARSGLDSVIGNTAAPYGRIEEGPRAPSKCYKKAPG